MRMTLALAFLVALTTHAQERSGPPAPIVFFDIAGAENRTLTEFYSALFNWSISAEGNFSTPVVSPLAATIRQDPPETLLYIGVEDVTATLERIVEHGGSVELPRLEVPGVVVLGLFKDPAGNRVGLVEIEGGKAKVP